MANTFQCAIHDFSTDNIIQWDEHCVENEHEYDLHTECECGVSLHIKPKQKLGPNAKRIPRGFKCIQCKQIVIDAPEIKEAGEIINA